jgi:hypothetical protein
LIAAVSDGAGSAKFAEIGSETVCLSILQSAAACISADPTGNSLSPEQIGEWIRAAQRTLAEKAKEKSAELRDFACTLIGAILLPTRSVFFQVGDGAVVRWDGETYRLIFQPDRGEYANNTFFVTEDRVNEHTHYTCVEQKVEEVALLSDGLQMLAIDYARNEAHAPFFRSLFSPLRKTETTEEVDALDVPLMQFLQSQKINDRTDDDKTLVLATCILPPAEAPQQPASPVPVNSTPETA